MTARLVVHNSIKFGRMSFKRNKWLSCHVISQSSLYFTYWCADFYMACIMMVKMHSIFYKSRFSSVTLKTNLNKTRVNVLARFQIILHMINTCTYKDSAKIYLSLNCSQAFIFTLKNLQFYILTIQTEYNFILYKQCCTKVFTKDWPYMYGFAI